MKNITKLVLIVCVLFTTFTPILGEQSNSLINGAFKEIVSAPKTQLGPNGTHWDVDLWENDIKPKGWIYQLYKPGTANPKDYAAKINEKHEVRLHVADTSNVNKKAFFKQMNIPVKENAEYKLKFEFKNEDLIQDLTLNIDYKGTGKSQTIKLDKDISEFKEIVTQLVVPKGAKNIDLVFRVENGNKGAYWLRNISMEEVKPTLENIAFSQENIILSKGDTHHLELEVTPSHYDVSNLKWENSNDNVVVLEGRKITAITPGTSEISVSAEGIKAAVKVEVIDDNTVKGSFVKEKIVVPNGEKRYLGFNVYPSDTEIKFSVKGENIIVDNQGLIEAKSVGTSIVELLIGDKVLDNVEITVSDNDRPSAFVNMESKWIEKVAGSGLVDSNNPYYKAYVENIENETRMLMKSANDRGIWNLNLASKVANMTETFTRLKKVAMAFGMEDSIYFEDKELYTFIVEGLQSAYREYDYGVSTAGNWWDYQIGSAQQIIDTLILLNNYTDSEVMDDLIDPLHKYIIAPNKRFNGYTETGANLTDTGLNVLGLGILLDDENRLTQVQTQVAKVFKLVTKGDGLYKDGSIVQHGYYAYLGSYGNELLKGVAQAYNILEGTPWIFAEEELESIFIAIEEGMLKSVHQGQLMASIQGRSMSRAPGTNKYSTSFMGGNEVGANLLVMAKFAPKPLQEKIYSHVSNWIVNSKDHYYYLDNPRDLQHLENLLIAQEKGMPLQVESYYHVYTAMDRVVKKSQKYTANISMYSSRIANFESINNENKKGWHTGDGVFYLYNDDQRQYGESYWATVDPYRLAGITADTRPLKDGEGKGTRSSESFVGGVTDGVDGSAVMILNKNQGKDLKAQKSYFMFEDVIVHLGSNINATTDHNIETIIENRMIDQDKLMVNGKMFGGNVSKINEDTQVYFDTGDTESSVGYYIPGKQSLSVRKEVNEGTFKEINSLFASDTVYKQGYFKLVLDHGDNPTNDTYEYYVLPGATQTELQAFADASPIKVIRNDVSAQAIYHSEEKKLMINAFGPTTIDLNSLDLPMEFIEIDEATSIILDFNDEIVLTASNPAQDNRMVTVTFSEKINSSSDIFKVQEEKKVKYQLDGFSYQTKINTVLDRDELDNLIASLRKEENLTIYSENKRDDALNRLNPKTQKDVDAAVNYLKDLEKELEYKLDLSKALELLEASKNSNKEDYTEISWSLYEEAKNNLAFAVSIYDEMAPLVINQVEIDYYVDAYLGAFESLEKEEIKIDDEDDLDDEVPKQDLDVEKEDSSKVEHLPTTGSSSLWVGVGLISLLFGIYLYFKKYSLKE